MCLQKDSTACLEKPRALTTGPPHVPARGGGKRARSTSTVWTSESARTVWTEDEPASHQPAPESNGTTADLQSLEQPLSPPMSRQAEAKVARRSAGGMPWSNCAASTSSS